MSIFSWVFPSIRRFWLGAKGDEIYIAKRALMMIKITKKLDFNRVAILAVVCLFNV